MKRIAIIGAGGFGREVQMLIEQINAQKQEWQLVGFYDDGISLNQMVNGFPVLGSVASINQIKEPTHLVLAIGNPTIKRKIVSELNSPLIQYATLIHPNVIMGDKRWLKIGEGSIICAGNILTVQIDIGSHVIINLSCTVGHDSSIGNFSSLMPSVNVSGEVNIGEAVFIGTGVKIINQVTIGSDTTIGAGAVVTSAIPARCTAVGVPAKPVKFHT
jgi:sugar O-acyltransferase (sialic acid O-acetyltransferase NeuD family)